MINFFGCNFGSPNLDAMRFTFFPWQSCDAIQQETAHVSIRGGWVKRDLSESVEEKTPPKQPMVANMSATILDGYEGSNLELAFSW